MFVPISSYRKVLEENQKEKFDRWCKKNNIVKLDNKNKQWYRILPGLKNIYSASEHWLTDHRSIFKKENDSFVFVIQPYKTEQEVLRSDVFEWAKKRGLKVEIDAENSWHHEDTILIQFEIEDIQVLKHYISENRVPYDAKTYFIE